MIILDVSNDFEIGSVDDESLPVTRCACGCEFKGWSDYVLSIYEDTPHECPKCHRKFFFRNSIRIYEVIDEILEA